MNEKTTLLSLHHAKLILGFTHQTLTPAQHDELDDWICETDENMEIFEELTGAIDAKMLSMDELIIATEDITDLWVIGGLVARHLQGLLESSQKTQLDEWLQAAEKHRQLFKTLCNPANLQKLILQMMAEVNKKPSQN